MGHRLRLLSANLWNGRADPSGFADLVESQGADLVAAQELAPEQAEALADVLPHGRLEPARDYHGMGIALRHPASMERVSLPVRDARVARLDPADWPGLGRSLEVVNVHIFGVHLWPYWRSIATRWGQLQGLHRYLEAAPRQSRILVGDFNTPPSWPAYRRLCASLRDAALTAARRRGTRPALTWAPRPHLPRMVRIDHALVEGLEVEDVRVVPVPGSDHWALVVDLEVGPTGPGGDR